MQSRAREAALAGDGAALQTLLDRGASAQGLWALAWLAELEHLGTGRPLPSVLDIVVGAAPGDAWAQAAWRAAHGLAVERPDDVLRALAREASAQARGSPPRFGAWTLLAAAQAVSKASHLALGGWADAAGAWATEHPEGLASVGRRTWEHEKDLAINTWLERGVLGIYPPQTPAGWAVLANLAAALAGSWPTVAAPLLEALLPSVPTADELAGIPGLAQSVVEARRQCVALDSALAWQRLGETLARPAPGARGRL